MPAAAAALHLSTRANAALHCSPVHACGLAFESRHPPPFHAVALRPCVCAGSFSTPGAAGTAGSFLTPRTAPTFPRGAALHEYYYEPRAGTLHHPRACIRRPQPPSLRTGPRMLAFDARCRRLALARAHFKVCAGSLSTPAAALTRPHPALPPTASPQAAAAALPPTAPPPAHHPQQPAGSRTALGQRVDETECGQQVAAEQGR
ncbi:hypothetical protein GGX14DRAFT_567843 [Mycena pura]|uniref:Uncharacterized protein n=1 Tax=Mycena pura TaxID=153505 RepID=A0AAD6VDQ9_9AGAR|nr:hypothetical protein GGX14DRAFT_567843 [Mycena pura]